MPTESEASLRLPSWSTVPLRRFPVGVHVSDAGLLLLVFVVDDVRDMSLSLNLGASREAARAAAGKEEEG